MTILAILFDLDDTLIVDETISREAFAETARLAREVHGADPERFERTARAEACRLWTKGPAYPYCREIGISAFEGLWGKFEGEDGPLKALGAWVESYRNQVFEDALREQLIEPPDGGEELANRFSIARRKLQRLMPDAVETLARIKPAYKLGLLTNGAPDLQREKLQASGLGPFFDAVAVSGEHGIGKPSPEIFHRLLAELGVSASQTVMVGNSLERDIAGARNAGILPIWIKVPGSEEPADVQPAETITALAELPGILTKLQHGPNP